MIKWFLILLIGSMVTVGVNVIGQEDFNVPQGWPKPVYDFKKHPVDSNKVVLGRMLFYDPILSADSSVSCASCHSPYNAFAHVDHQLSHGIGDRIGKRNAPALINLAWNKNFMWDGSVTDLDMQALIPIAHPDEMGSDINLMIQKIRLAAKYRSAFTKAFGDTAINAPRVSVCLSQFVLQLISADSKYDSVMRKQAVFNAQEKNGYRLFKKNCSSCHTEPLFTNNQFENNGLAYNSNLNDSGRMKITGNPSDFMAFKVPTLRNISFTPPYMHDGRFQKLSEVLKHYLHLNGKEQGISHALRNGITMNADQIPDIIAFLLTLGDKHFVFNPAYAYPKGSY